MADKVNGSTAFVYKHTIYANTLKSTENMFIYYRVWYENKSIFQFLCVCVSASQSQIIYAARINPARKPETMYKWLSESTNKIPIKTLKLFQTIVHEIFPPQTNGFDYYYYCNLFWKWKFCHFVEYTLLFHFTIHTSIFSFNFSFNKSQCSEFFI